MTTFLLPVHSFLLPALLSCAPQDAPPAGDLRPPHRCDESFYSQDEVRLFEEDVQLTCRGLTDEEFDRTGAMMVRVRTALENLGLKRGGALGARVRHADVYLDPANCYSNENTLTMRLPCTQFYLDGGPVEFDPVYATLDVIAEATWSRVIRPIRYMPLAAREAINRLYSRAALAELGADGAWWPGKARPREGSLLNLPADHPTVKLRDRILEQLEQAVDRMGREALEKAGDEGTTDARRLGVLRFSDRANLWTRSRMDGQMAYQDLENLLRPEEAGEEFQLIEARQFQTRVPFEEESRAERFRGLTAIVPIGMKMEAWYGDFTVPPRQFVSLRQGDPTLLLSTPDKGSFRLASVEVFAHRRGEFGEEVFDVVLMDGEGRETFRWSYPIASLPEDGEAAWVVLENTCYPYVQQNFLVAVEVPVLREGQDVEIGFVERETGDHSFLHDDGVFRSTDQPGDLAMKVRLNARGVPNATEMLRLIRKFAQDANR